MPSLGLPAGTFDDVADDAIWGSPVPATSPSSSDAPRSGQRPVPSTSRAFQDAPVDVVDDYDVDVNLARKLSARPTGGATSADRNRKELFLLGSTFKSDNVTVDYVAANLSHTMGMNPRVANKLAKKLRRNHGSIAISLGVMSYEKCDEMEKTLKLRDIDCQSMPVAPSTHTFSNNTAVERPTRTTNASIAGSVPPPPPPPADDCSEARSHNSQTPTPRTGNIRKAFGFGGEQYQQQHHSSAASMSSRTASSRKPNHIAAGAHHNANNIDFGDVTARSRTKGAGPSSSAASVASQQQHQSLIFSSGNYDGEKRFDKPHGKGTFSMPGQFSYTGDWARGNPVGSGYFKLASGEIREGSWTGTNFIETRRYFAKKHNNAPKKTIPASARSVATKASTRSGAVGQMNVVVESKSSPSKSATSSLGEPSLSPRSRAENSKKEFAVSADTKRSADYPAECAPYMILFRTLTKPSALKSGSLSIQGETTVAIMSYDDVGTYEGEWMGGNMDGLPHGMGSFDFSDGTRYYGEFSNGMPSGDGRFTFKDGSVFSRADHNGISSANSVPQTPATEASSHPSESSHDDCSPMSNVTMSPVLSTTAKKDKDELKIDSIDNASIDIPALKETTKEVPDAISLDGEPALTFEKDSEEAVVEASEGNELPSRLLPYKRGPSIPNITSFSPKETESVEVADEVVDLAAKAVDEPLVFLDDGSTSSVQSPVRGGLNALLQNKLDEDPESVHHLIETPFVLKLDETRQDVMKYLDTTPGKTTSASYVYSEIGTYNGEFCDGYPHGIGTFFWIDGTTYSGNFAEGEPDGDGKLVLPSGEMFVRSAESNDVIHIPAQQKDDVSVAKSVDSNISSQSVESGEAGKYKGQIVAGVPHGLGSMKFANGSKYTGQWRNGSPAKEGTFYFPNGERHYGRWNGSKFEPIKKEKGPPVSPESLIWDDEDVTQSPLPTVEEEEESGERSCSASVKSGASSSVESSPRPHRANNHSPRRLEKQNVELDEDSPRLNRAGGVTHLDTDSVGDMSGIESMIASIEMSAFSDIEDASVYSQLSGKSSTPKKSTGKKKKKSKFSLKSPKKNGDADAKSQFDEKSASQGDTSRNSLPIDIDDASFYSTDDDDVDVEQEEKSRVSSLSSGSTKPKQLRPSKSACLYYNGFTAKCRPYLSSLRCIRLFSTKKSGSLQMENGKSIAGVTYSDIGEYDGEWRGSMLKGVPHGHGQFSWGDGTRYVGEWDQGIPVGQDGHFVFLDGSICNRGKGIVVVQSLARGFLARQSIVKQQAKELDEAATTIQSAWRIHDAPHREQRIAATILIQNVYRSHTTTKASAATRIQTAVRASTTRADFLEKKSSAILIQTEARRYVARASFLGLTSACIALQARLRGNLLRKEFEDRYIDVDALVDDEDSVQTEEVDTPEEGSTEEINEEQQPSQLALAAQVYPPECAAYLSSLDLSSVNRKGSLYWNENGKHASLTYTTKRVQYNGMWKGSLLDGKPHGEGKMKFSDRTKFYGSFVDGIPTDQGYFKLKNGVIIYSRRIGAIREEILNELLCIGDRLETEFVIYEMYHESIGTALRLQLEVENNAVARNHLELAYLLEEDFILTEQKKITALEESIKQIEAELTAKRAAEIAALAAFRRSVELQEAIARKRAATKIQAVIRGDAGRRLAQLESTRRSMANDMYSAALRCEEENALPQDNIVAIINYVDALEEHESSEEMAFRFLSDPTVKANSNTFEKITYLHRKGLSFQKIDKVINEVQGEMKKAAATKKAAKLEAEMSSGLVDDNRSSSNDNSSDNQSRNTVSTSASSSLSADAPTAQNKKRLFRPSAVAKKVRSVMAGGNKGHEEWTASAIHAMPVTANDEEDGESALAGFAALQATLDSVISEKKD